MRRLLGLLLITLAVTNCDGAPPPLAEWEPHPALWEVANESGEVEGWLFGTVHALPDGTRWRWPQLNATIASAEMLVVEVANLDDDEAMASAFQALAFDTPAIPLRSRISTEYRDKFDALLGKSGSSSTAFDRMETWAAALALAQLAQDGGQENGVDRALISDFDGRRVFELEGAAAQLAIFDALPEKEQRDLIDAVIVEAASTRAEDQTLAEDWRRGDLGKLAETSEQGILADPELREALLQRRNRDWAEKVDRLFAEPERPLIAVGAGHLVGEESLVRLLEARGYNVRRID